MKSYYFLVVLFFINATYSQTLNDELIEIAEAEAKSASARIEQRFLNNNTGNYDVKYHRLEFNVNPSIANISGDVTTYFEAKEDLNTITFELTNNMIVSQVTRNGSSLSFSQNGNDEVVVNLSQTQNIGVLDSLTISYSGNPESSGFGSFEQSTHNGDPVIWTLSEPYGAKGWWPCKQDLNDKIDSIDVFITTPRFNASNEEYVSVSNGLEQSQVINGVNKTTHFKHRFPIPAYLIAIAATNYEVYSHTVSNEGNPFDIVNYVYPESLASAQTNTAITVDIMELFSNRFEEYPYASEKYGHAQFGWGGGMEHTTVSFMGSFSRGLIAHELAHQWFGDKITCGSWKDIWLNEGFATYLSGLVIEDFDGDLSFKNWKLQKINSITSQLDGAVYLTDQDTTSVGRIFSSRLSYNKGAMVLHMLRKKVGDPNFYQGMQDYLGDQDLAYNYAKTPDYMLKMENASGEDLSEFFNDWIYNQGYPSYTIGWNQFSSTQIQFQINQTQSHASVDYFEAPIPLRLIGSNNETLDIVLDNTFSGETFQEIVNFSVIAVQFDPEIDLISKNNQVVLGIDEYNIQSDFIMYPNPTNSHFYINKPEDIDINSIKIYNVIGKLVLESNSSEIVNVEALSSGLHFVQFETSKGSIYKRLIKN